MQLVKQKYFAFFSLSSYFNRYYVNFSVTFIWRKGILFYDTYGA